jgi:folylpolyglutamate synthase/dihydrofolate synthase
VEENFFKRIENHYIKLNQRENINASEYEILTATAFTIFNDSRVKVGVIEVGMGGLLDSTNILNNQVISVIAKIGRDHEKFLGNTLQEIAKHKAGILRPNVPYIVNPENELNVRRVIDDYAKQIGAGPRLSGDTPQMREGLYSSDEWRWFASAIRPWQRDNAVLGIIAAKEASKSLGETMHTDMIANELLKVRFQTIPGRMQGLKIIPVFGSENSVGRKILLDGAHNLDAAVALKDYVDKVERRLHIKELKKRRHGWPITWVLAMTEGKDARSYLQTILQDGDNVITTAFGPVDGMPWVKPMDPTALLEIAQSVKLNITGLAIPKPGALRALCAAKYLAEHQLPIVITGSLYLAGDLHREMRGKTRKEFWTRPLHEADRQIMKQMHTEERERVQRLQRNEPVELEGERDAAEPETALQKQKRLAREIESLDRELQSLDIEQEQLRKPSTSRYGPWASEVLETDSISKGPWSISRRNTFPPPTPYPRTNRPFPGQFKELRIREGQLGDGENVARNSNEGAINEQQDPQATRSDTEGETQGPRIRMHWGVTKGEDRRLFSRPDFIKEKKWGV